MKDGDSRHSTEIAVFSFLERGLAQLSLPVTPEQTNQLTDLVVLLDQWAAKINLTGHRDPISMAGRLVLDAAALADTLPELRAARSLADLGTGAGFPGLPISILFPEIETHLVDSRLKRNHFQREARRRLRLENVHPILGRSDQVDVAPCELVLAQAMAAPERALALMAQWATPSGVLALPASDTATPPAAPPGFGAPEPRSYSVPETHVHRQLWVLKPSES